MLSSGIVASGREVPTGASYTLTLLLHVASAVVGFGSVVITGVQAARARQGPAAPSAHAVRRYFSPGVNWVARALYLVPVSGFLLIAESSRAFEVSDGFVVAGLGLWLAAAVLAEIVLWPAERRIQRIVTEGFQPGDALESACGRTGVAACLLGLAFVAAVAVMIAKP